MKQGKEIQRGYWNTKYVKTSKDISRLQLAAMMQQQGLDSPSHLKQLKDQAKYVKLCFSDIGHQDSNSWKKEIELSPDIVLAYSWSIPRLQCREEETQTDWWSLKVRIQSLETEEVKAARSPLAKVMRCLWENMRTFQLPQGRQRFRNKAWNSSIIKNDKLDFIIKMSYFSKDTSENTKASYRLRANIYKIDIHKGFIFRLYPKVQICCFLLLDAFLWILNICVYI